MYIRNRGAPKSKFSETHIFNLVKNDANNDLNDTGRAPGWPADMMGANCPIGGA